MVKVKESKYRWTSSSTTRALKSDGVYMPEYYYKDNGSKNQSWVCITALTTILTRKVKGPDHEQW